MRHSSPQRKNRRAETEAILDNKAQRSPGELLIGPWFGSGAQTMFGSPCQQHCFGGCRCLHPQAKSCSKGWRRSIGRTLPSLALSTPPASVLEFTKKKKKKSQGRVLTTTKSVDPPKCRRVGCSAPVSAWAPAHYWQLRPQECLPDP